MCRRLFALAVCLAAAASLLLAETQSKTIPLRVEAATWSRSAHPLPYALNPDPALRNARIPSPNGKYAIACNSVPQEHRISEGVSETREAPACEFEAEDKRVLIDLEVGPEALWAPDSDAVAVTHSRGGALGTYRVLIYRPENSGATDIANAVRQDLAKRFPACAGARAECTSAQRKAMRKDVEWVNVAAIRWMEKSDRLLMLAWVPDSSAFGANLGRYNGYVVDARHGRILSRYSEREFKRRFKKYCGDWGL
jgi:hypothetical protein